MDNSNVLADLPSEEEILQKINHLSDGDKYHFKVIYESMAQRLGSHIAARLWLITQGAGWQGSPLDSIIIGNANLVLDCVNAANGQDYPYS